MADTVRDTFIDFCESVETGQKMEVDDFYQFINKGFSRAVEKVLFSNQTDNVFVDVIMPDGSIEKMSTINASRYNLDRCFERFTQIENVLLPELTPYFSFPRSSNKIHTQNCTTLRATLHQLIEDRKQSKVKYNDFLSMMMENEIFESNNDHIIDEALTFYIASS